VDISALRRPPELPEEYFALCTELDREINALALVGRPHNLASLHAVLALETIAHELRPLGEREIHARRQVGLPVSVTDFSLAMHGCHRGLTILLRAIDGARRPDAFPAEVDGDLQDEGLAALRGVNHRIEMYTVLDDVAIGWREFEVDGYRVRAPSRSPERFGRSISVGIRAEAERNGAFIAASADSTDSPALHQRLLALAGVVPHGINFEPDDRTLGLAEAGTHRAEEMLSDWIVAPETVVTGAFTAGEYRAASEAVKAYAGAGQIFDDYREPRDPARLPLRTREQWIAYIRARVAMDEAHADAILVFLTHAASDVRDGGRASPSAAHTPFLDLGDGRLALVPTLAIWHDGQHALRTIWKTRAPNDYNTTISALNHDLSAAAGALFAAKGWAHPVRRPVPGAGDIDAGTGEGTFFITGECKVFIDDPVRGADDPVVWRELERNVRAMRDRDLARRVLAPERLAPEEIVGLIIVPGRAQSPVDFGDEYALVGLVDLADRVAESATPRELWTAIKAHESQAAPRVVTVTEQIGPWTIESDGVHRTELTAPGGARV
jgi:hypothetical protein